MERDAQRDAQQKRRLMVMALVFTVLVVGLGAMLLIGVVLGNDSTVGQQPGGNSSSSGQLGAPRPGPGFGAA